MKSFKEFIQEVENDPNLLEQLKTNPIKTLKEISDSSPAYYADKMVYRVVVFGFSGVLLLGVIYFLYQYQHSINMRKEYSIQILNTIKGISQSDTLSELKLNSLKNSLVSAAGLNGTTPDGVIAVFTAIVGALAGLFAPSPLSKNS
jgi:hypothetical protein